MDLIYFISGVVAAAAAILLFHKIRGEQVLGLFSLSLVAAAVVYAVFSFVGLAFGSAGGTWLAIEFAGIAIFLIPAYLGSKGRPWLVSLGWMLHLFWDLVLHGGPETAFVPWFYPVFCVGFDLAFAAYIAYHFYFRKGA